MKNKYIKRVLSLFLALLILSPLSLVSYGLGKAEKLEKEEIIYAKLDFNGENDLLIAVSGFPEGFKGKDYGDFSEVANLSTPEELVYKDGSINIDAKENFYYQGKLKTKDLPWHISMKWTLDGLPIAEEDLLGKSGHLKLVYNIRPNPACCSKYFDYYIVQSGFNFNVDQVRNLEAPDGTQATAGSVKMVNFMSFPGETSTYVLEADVDNYEPGMVQIGALPLNLALDLSEISEYTGDLKTLELAIAQLNGGTWEFLDGLYQIKEGATAYKNAGHELLSGLDQLTGGLKGLTDGSSQISEGLGDYSEGVAEFEEG
ncbi:MAG TPA: hypothetical protein VFD08_01850, partial [Clostridia bacterium]|nr:hypothetical protein [Clostridia bacterium]